MEFSWTLPGSLSEPDRSGRKFLQAPRQCTSERLGLAAYSLQKATSFTKAALQISIRSCLCLKSSQLRDKGTLGILYKEAVWVIPLGPLRQIYPRQKQIPILVNIIHCCVPPCREFIPIHNFRAPHPLVLFHAKVWQRIGVCEKLGSRTG